MRIVEIVWERRLNKCWSVRTFASRRAVYHLSWTIQELQPCRQLRVPFISPGLLHKNSGILELRPGCCMNLIVMNSCSNGIELSSTTYSFDMLGSSSVDSPATTWPPNALSLPAICSAVGLGLDFVGLSVPDVRSRGCLAVSNLE